MAANLSSGLALFISRVLDEDTDPITVEHYGFATPNSSNLFHCLSALRAKFPAGNVHAEKFADGQGFRITDYDGQEYIAVLASAAARDERLSPTCTHAHQQTRIFRDGRQVDLFQPRCLDCGATLERKGGRRE